MSNQNQRPAQRPTASRLGLATPAIRPGMHGRVLLAGPSGSGKTYSGLLIASVLAGPDRVTRSILQIDTEKDSGRTYADDFVLADGTPGYLHLPWSAPYNATDLAMTLREASSDPEIRVVVVDSHTHFWRGEGGVLDVSSGRWTGWKEARPMQADMVDAILGCDAHVILCARMVQENVQEKNEATGKIEVRKLGMKVQQDSDLEYEVNVGVEMDMNHIMRITKSRTRAVPVGKEFIAGHSEEFAGVYRDWLEGGEPAASKQQTDALVETLNRIDDAANRQAAKLAFVDAFGRPEMLLVSRLPEAQEWVANRLLGIDDPADRAPDAVPPETESIGGESHEQGEAPPDGGDAQPTPAEAARQADKEQAVPASETDPGTSDPAPDPGAQNAAQAGSVALAREAIESEVERMELGAIQAALHGLGRSPNGSLRKLREKLVTERLKAIEPV